MNISGNQTTDLGSLMVTNDTATTTMGNLIPYSNPSFGFTLEFPSNWQKEESLTFVSPQGGIDNRAQVISITTEVLPTSDFSLDTYSKASLGQVKSFQDFKLLNLSSITLAGLPAHMIVYLFIDESETPLQNLQTWTVKDGTAYIITYTGTPEEFESSLPVLQSVMDSFRLE
jgi:serine/threonine-protein kinase